jgi:transposase
MAKRILKKHSDEFKLKVALAAIKGDRTVAELCNDFSVTGSQIHTWKKQLEEQGARIFADRRKTENQKDEVDKLHRIIGKITAERDFLSRVLDR